MRMGIGADMCMDMCVDMCVDMCIDMCINVFRLWTGTLDIGCYGVSQI